MAHVTLDQGMVNVSLSLPEQMFSFHGSFHIPLAHVTNAYVSSLSDLELQWRLFGTGAGSLMTGGIFTTPEGIIFCDIHGQRDCLVIETQGERFRRLAFTLDKGQDPNAIAHQITKA
jgi:hypothetical protein